MCAYFIAWLIRPCKLNPSFCFVGSINIQVKSLPIVNISPLVKIVQICFSLTTLLFMLKFAPGIARRSHTSSLLCFCFLTPLSMLFLLLRLQCAESEPVLYSPFRELLSSSSEVVIDLWFVLVSPFLTYPIIQCLASTSDRLRRRSQPERGQLPINISFCGFSRVLIWVLPRIVRR